MVKREREAPEVAAAATRMLRALVRRAGDGELEALEALRDMQATLDEQLAAAVRGYRASPVEASWTTIGSIMGTSRQAARQRWAEL
jgi:hypothetical protein